MKLDAIDLRILAELQADGSLSNVELARRVHLSPSPCLARVKALEAAGVISRYVALANAAALGLGLNVFISVSLKTQSKEALADFERRIAEQDEVMECYLMTGDSDYLLRVGQDVLQILQPHRQAHQPFADAVLGALFGRVGGVRHAGRVLGQAFGVAQADGAGDQAQRVHEAAPASMPSLSSKAIMPPAGHLAPRQFVLGEAGQAGEMHHENLAGCAARNSATALRVAQWRSMRSARVLRPRSTRKASCADSTAPVMSLRPYRRTLGQLGVGKDGGTGGQVAMAAEVLGHAECTLTSAPSTSGRCR
jgi:Lrp/AsnC family leucine-responsive transcriptional regulator